MSVQVCPISMAGELKQCVPACKFYNSQTGECLLVEAAKKIVSSTK